MSVLLVSILLLIPALLLFRRRKPSKRVPPGSLGIPIIGQSLGLLRAMRANTAEKWVEDRIRKYGPISKLSLFGKQTVLIHGQAANKYIFSNNGSTLANQQTQSIKMIMGDRNLLELSGEDHKRVRSALMSFLKPESLKLYVGKIDEEVRRHLEMHWQGKQQVKISRGFTDALLEAELKSHGLLVNNFAELDGEEYVQHYERTTGHKAWHLGPACLVRRTDQEKAERGQKSLVSDQECLSWLNTKKANSVVYICFGTVCCFPDKQLYEIACGVEASGREFIWVVPEKKGKENESEEEKNKWLPKGFGGKGMIIRGWAPQLLILAHPAVGAILTHCGWNSTVEAVSAGIPMITWPVHSDQFYNERLICEVRGIGVEVGAEEWSDIGFGDRETLVGRDRVERAVRRLMDGGDEAHEFRQRAQEFGKKARAAVEEGGSSHKNFTMLIDELKLLRDSKPLHRPM